MSLSRFLPLCLLSLLVLAASASAQYTGPAAGQKVAFLGDSITALGYDAQGGYLHLIDSALAQEGHKITVIPEGISGQTSKDMLARIGDVLSKHPDCMLLSCGVNDVWHGAQGVPLDQYKKNITSMVDQARAAGVKVTLLASTPIGYTNFHDDNNTKLVAYNDFLRSLAQQDNLPFADINKPTADGSTALAKHDPHQGGNMVTLDGVHPNMLGFEIMAVGILKAWGFTDAQLAEVTPAWQQIPVGMTFAIMGFDNNQGVSLHDYLAMRAYAESQNKSVGTVLVELLQGNIKQIASTNPKNQIDPAKLSDAKSQ